MALQLDQVMCPVQLLVVCLWAKPDANQHAVQQVKWRWPSRSSSRLWHCHKGSGTWSPSCWLLMVTHTLLSPLLQAGSLALSQTFSFMDKKKFGLSPETNISRDKFHLCCQNILAVGQQEKKIQEKTTLTTPPPFGF